MTATEEFLALEVEGWNALTSGRAVAYYGRILADNAILLMPDISLNREEALELWAGGPPWKSYKLSATKAMRITDNIVAVTYLVTAGREGLIEPYRAWCTSVYALKNTSWRLTFHEQTVLPPVFHDINVRSH